MADTLQVAPYEVLIRFTCEVGEEFNKVRGVHIQRRRYLVGEDGKITGRVEPRKEDLAAPVALADLKKLLGGEADLIEHADETRRDKERTESELTTVRAQLSEARDEVKRVTLEVSDAQQAVAVLRDQLTVLQEAPLQDDEEVRDGVKPSGTRPLTQTKKTRR